MSESKNTSWRNRVYRLYLVSLIAWSAAVLLLLVKLLTSRSVPETGLAGAPSAILLMMLALPGLLYFFLKCRKLRTAELSEAHLAFDQIMIIQHITGIAAMAGGVLGLLPFLVNFFGVITMSSGEDFWMNLGLIVPWTSLYGFITTYIVALVINRSRKKQRV